MQTPTNKTSVSKCIDLAAYAGRMLGKFPANAVLASLATKMAAIAQPLSAAQTSYEAGVKAILLTRVDVKYANLVSDRRIRLVQQNAEIADGKPNGSIEASAFPEGSAPITRLVGASQVKAMVDLEGRLAPLAKLWPASQTEMAAIAEQRADYDAAVKGREAAGQTARKLKAARDVARDAFVTEYTEIIHRVEAEFPRDKAMQDLFFDDVRTASTTAEADGNVDPSPEPAPPPK